MVNKCQENVKSIAGVRLGHNLKAMPGLSEAVADATLLIFVTLHQLIKGLRGQIQPSLSPGAKAISLTKGMDDSRRLRLVRAELGVECSVLMGANIANEIALERFSEATVGFDPVAESTGAQWLFSRHSCARPCGV